MKAWDSFAKNGLTLIDFKQFAQQKTAQKEYGLHVEMSTAGIKNLNWPEREVE